MILKKALAPAALLCALPVVSLAEVPSWLSGTWQTRSQVVAPDGALVRVKCTLEASSATDMDWQGILRCASVQGRLEGTWVIELDGANTVGVFTFSKPEFLEVEVQGESTAETLSLKSVDGQKVRFDPGPDGSLIVEMKSLGPLHLTGKLNFVPR